jgi:AraC family transcriptional regulator of adaptative response / methylphosphotriester-DNA alkyltransferase methyltransferase
MEATLTVPKRILARQHEITADYLKAIDKHLDDLLQNRTLDMYEIRDFADEMHIHPTHLSNTIKLTTGQHPCFFFEQKIMEIAKAMLQENNTSVAEIAGRLTFDPSNFTKFFKRFEVITPKQYREKWLMRQLDS